MSAANVPYIQIPPRHSLLRAAAAGSTASTAYATRHRVRVSVRCLRHSSTLPQSSDIYLFNVFLSASPVCLASVTESTPSGTRGLVADRPIRAGHIVLEVAECNVLRVPKQADCVSEWRQWLKVYTAAHGPLPSALVVLLADTKHHHSSRLAAWLLYLKNTCQLTNNNVTNLNKDQCPSSNEVDHEAGTHSSSGSRDYWCDYTAVLLSSDPSTAMCGGGWSKEELQLLEPPGLQRLCSYYNTMANKAAVKDYVMMTNHKLLADLQLADSSHNVRWALGMVHTRAHGCDNYLSLYPVHDMMNHAEADAATVRGRDARKPGIAYEMQATRDLSPGQELTHTYRANLSNPELLIGWGFTLNSKSCDWVVAVQQQHGCLPLLSWRVVVQAAAAVIAKHCCQQQQQQVEDSDSSSSSSSNLKIRLASAAANLPLHLPEDVAAIFAYKKAAAAAIQSQQQQQGHWQQQPHEVFGPLIPDSQQRANIETLFLQDLEQYLQNEVLPPLPPRQQQQQQQQILTATAILHSCLIELAACTTTAAEDKRLLNHLHTYQHCHDLKQQLLLLPTQQQQVDQILDHIRDLQLQVVARLSVLRAYSSLRSLSEIDTEAGGNILTAYQDQVATMEHQLGLSPWQDTTALRRSVQAVHQHMQDVITPLLQQQQELQSQITDLKASTTYNTNITDLSDLNLVIDQRGQNGAVADHSGRALHNAMGGESQSGVVSDQVATAPAGSATGNLVAGLLPASVSPARLLPASVSPASVSSARLLVAVSARLHQKQMLEATAELCRECIRLLTHTPRQTNISCKFAIAPVYYS